MSLGGSKQKASMIEIANDKSWEYTVLGLNNAWIEEIEIPDMVMSMLGVVPSDSIDADDINGRKAYHKHLEDRYNEKGLS